MSAAAGPVIGIVGWKNSGKTTLIERLVGHLVGQGLTVSTVKHAHHGVEIDQEGRDSWRHRQAGAHEVLVATARRWALIRELREEPEPPLVDLLARLAPCDLVLIEGFKSGRHAKIEVHRRAIAAPLIGAGDETVLAVASDEALPALARPVLELDDIAAIADFSLRHARVV